MARNGQGTKATAGTHNTRVTGHKAREINKGRSFMPWR